MAYELPLLVGGIVLGATVAVLVLRSRPPANVATSKLTTAWRLSELHKPVIVARDVGMAVPPGTRLVASGLVEDVVHATCEVRQVPPVRAEFALDRETKRAILLLGGLQEGGMAVVATDPATFERLDAEFRRLWDQGAPYLERRRISELAGRSGVPIETEGYVQDILPYQDRFMIRLEDAGATIGVVVDKDPDELRDVRIRVRGQIHKDKSGYPVLQAKDIRNLG